MIDTLVCGVVYNVLNAWSRLADEQPPTDTAAKTHDDGENETVIGELSVKTKTRDEQV